MLFKNIIELTILSISHFLVDSVSAASLYQGKIAPAIIALLIYNTCAFTTQCLMGMLPDRYGHGNVFVLLSSLIITIGVIIPCPPICKAVIVGLGNSLFHVSGGYLTLKNSDNMGPLGVFVAPGAIGLFIGSNFHSICLPFALILVFLSILLVAKNKANIKGNLLIEKQNKKDYKYDVTNDKQLSLTILLLFAIATRAVGGSVVSFPWQTGLLFSAITVFCVFLGKGLGGFVADKFGIRNTATTSIIIASILIVFCSEWMIPSLIGQFILNMSMPITLYLIYKLLPGRPGFAFGLAAAVLWPGTLIGQAIKLTGIWSGALTIICFTIGLFAICITERSIEK